MKQKETGGVRRLEIINVTDQTYHQEVIKSKIPVLAVFYAAWDPNSLEVLDEIIPRFQKKHKDKVKFVKIEVEGKGMEVKSFHAQRAKISRYPTLVTFVSGIYIDKVHIFRTCTKEEKIREIQKLISRIVK
jgi:thioredoxin-like negative regulator of GroEL